MSCLDVLLLHVSLIAKDVGAFCIYLLDICVSSFEVLGSFAHIFMKYLLLWYLNACAIYY